MKTLKEKKQLNAKEGMAMKKGAQTPLTTANALMNPQTEVLKVKDPPKDSLPESGPLSVLTQGRKHRVKMNAESCMALLDNGTQINTIMPKYICDHSLQMQPITNILGAKVACMGLGNTYIRPLGYIIIQVQVDRVQAYEEDQIALVILDLSKFMAQIPVILGTPYHQLHH